MPRYQWSQEMRRIETAVREQKDTATLARYAGDDRLRQRCQGTIVQLNQRYAQVANGAGLTPEYRRTFVQGFRDMKADELSMMSKSSSDDSINAASISHTKDEYAEMLKYAEEKGIHVYNIETFDGDIGMFKEQIDAIEEVRKEYSLQGRMTVRFGILNSDDLAETNQTGDVITFANLALRDKQETNRYLNSDATLATNDSKGIGYHEMGHVISKIYGNRGLDIAAEAYYNLHNQRLSRNETINYLLENVSLYSVYVPDEWRDKPYNRRYYNEVIPEVFSMDHTNPTDFSREFVRLLKERCGR